MNTKALEKMNKRTITNWHPSHTENNGIICPVPYFANYPNSNCLEQHIQIYKLIQEYVELFEDYEKMSSSGKRMLEERMNEIEKKLLKEYWIVSKSQNNPDKWIWCGRDW